MISKEEIYPKMGNSDKKGCTNTESYVCAQNREVFELHASTSNTRMSSGMVAAVPDWRKYHSRTQTKYQGSKMFNKLPALIRNEVRIGLLKKNLRTLLQ